jgi:hypothetical protein
MLICKFCNKECKNNNSHRNHERLCKSNPDRVYVSYTIGITAWNKGLTKETSEKLKSMAANTSNTLTGRPGRLHDTASRQNLAYHARKNQLGGHTSKIRLKYTQKDGTVINLQSSYEIRFATILDDLNIKWTRPEPLNWIDKVGKPHRYYPDFLVGNIFIDTKNDYLAVKDKPKIDAVKCQNNVDIRIVTEKFITKEYILALKA